MGGAPSGLSRFFFWVRYFLLSISFTTVLASVFSWIVWGALGVHALPILTLFLSGWVVAAIGFGLLAVRFRRAAPVIAAIVAALTLAAGLGSHAIGSYMKEIAETGSRKAAIPRQLAAAADQYFLENGVNLVEYDDLVGPERYLKSYHKVDGENPRVIFPLGTFHRLYSLRLSDGTTVSYSQLDGRDDFLPRFAPAEPFYPPGPTPPADGTYHRVLADGSRQEVSYRDGVPHGAFRCYLPDGRFSIELFYDDGLPVSPKPKSYATGEAAKLTAEADYTRAQNRFYTGDYAGAITRLNRALELAAVNPAAFELRGHARWRSGDYLGALADFWRGAALRRSLSGKNQDERR
jgi:hypothetical protein